jgi:hypothetical protein
MVLTLLVPRSRKRRAIPLHPLGLRVRYGVPLPLPFTYNTLKRRKEKATYIMANTFPARSTIFENKNKKKREDVPELPH